MKNNLFKYGILCAVFVTMLASCDPKPKVQEKPARPVIIAYVGGFRGLVDVNAISADKITHINYAFADVKDGKAFLTDEVTDTTNFRKLNELRQKNPDLKILISIGGWTRSRNFSDAVLTTERQKIFAKSAVEIMKNYNLDGVDIDWEYPAMPGDEGNVYRREDKQNYTLMFEAIRAELDALEKETDKKYLLTAAVGGSQNFIDNTEMGKAGQYLDYVNIMTYDYQSAEQAIHHTNLYSSDKYEGKGAADVAVKAYVAAGVPVEKLVMGIAFYGRAYSLKKDSSKGPGDPVAEQIRGAGYTYIKDSLVNRNENYRYWDESARAPYLFNFYKGVFVTYDDEESVKEKCRYVLENKMGGVMFWEYSSDPKEYLLNEINKNLK
jgi:chitinase